MDDNAIDLLLHEEGEHFRATHNRPASAALRRPNPRRSAVLLPVGAALAVGALATTVVLVRPDHPGKSPLATSKPSVPTSALPRSVVLDVDDVTDVELGGGWVAVSGGGIGQAASQHIELRRADDLTRVVATIPSVYKAGGPSCLAVDGDHLLWIDLESIPSDFDPGPSTRWSAWERNLRTGKQVQLASGMTSPAGAGPGGMTCPVVGQGYAAWNLDGRVVVRELATGTTVSYPDPAGPVAITPSGIVEDGSAGAEPVGSAGFGLQVVLRSGTAYSSRLVLASVQRGTDIAAGGDRVLVFTADPAADTNDGAVVSTCTLPDCSTMTEVRRDPGSGIAVIGDGWAAWSDLTTSPAMLRFDGGPTPTLEPGYAPFRTLAADGSTFAYCTQVESGAPITLHLVQVGARRG